MLRVAIAITRGGSATSVGSEGGVVFERSQITQPPYSLDDLSLKVSDKSVSLCLTSAMSLAISGSKQPHRQGRREDDS